MHAGELMLSDDLNSDHSGIAMIKAIESPGGDGKAYRAGHPKATAILRERHGFERDVGKQKANGSLEDESAA
jgi:hypothetical protein